MLRFLIRLLGIVVLLALVRAFIQWVYVQFNRPSQPASSSPAAVETRRDPACGAYVATAQSVKAMVRGREEHFCSAACRDKYLAA